MLREKDFVCILFCMCFQNDSTFAEIIKTKLLLRKSSKQYLLNGFYTINLFSQPCVKPINRTYINYWNFLAEFCKITLARIHFLKLLSF